jgi:hypothetical protein
MPFGATPSRWCVYQFHHLGEYSVLTRTSRRAKDAVACYRSEADAGKQCVLSYFGAAVGAGGSWGTSAAAGALLGAA